MRRNLLVAVIAATLIMTGCAGTTDGASPSAEGIVVHGDWTLEVVNTDGSVATSSSFSNALGDIGAESLKDLLSRTETAGEWHVELWGTPSPCNNTAGEERSCRATEVADFEANYFPTLTLDTSAAGALTLTGAVTIQNDSTINAVSTRLATCTSATADCLNSGIAPASFSGKAASDDPNDGFDEVAVTAGQQVQISVTFSFS